MLKQLFLLLLGSLTLFSCIESQSNFSKIPPGMWRGVLYLNPGALISGVKKNEITTNPDNSEQLPFNFEVIYNNESDFYIEIHNAKERIKVDDITFGRDRETAKDTLRIKFPEYDTYLSLVYEEKVMEGFWHVNYKDGYKIKFKAVHGDTARFKKGLTEPNLDVSGRWDVKFEYQTEDEYPGIGVFEQHGDQVTGTFLTETGDYRFLEGMVAGDKLYLSCFDGAHAFLFEGKSLKENELTGFFKSGTHYTAPFIATSNDRAQLTDPFQMNSITNPDQEFSFSFPDKNGEILTLEDSRFKGKSKIIEIMGTWCPNCMDATNFLKDFKKSENGKDIEIVSIAFERYTDQKKNLAQMRRYAEKVELPWPIVLGGNYKKSEASKAIF